MPERAARHLRTVTRAADPADGTGWFAEDAGRHRRDAPRYCPACGHDVSGPDGLVQEYWVADDRVFHCWCRACGWVGDVVRIERTVSHEAV